MNEIDLLKLKYERERKARKQAEQILEEKALELYEANEVLKDLNQNLEKEILKRTASLRKSEDQYRNLVEHAQDFLYNIDDEGYFIYVNAIGIRKFGFSEEEVVGKRYTDFIPLEDREREFEYYTQFKEKGLKSDYHEFRVKTKDGSILWMGQNVTRVDREDGTFYFNAVARNITKRKEAEKALELARMEIDKSEIKYRSIIENMELGLMEVDNNGIIVRTYDRFNSMLGYNQGELIGKNANEVLLVPGYEKVLKEQDASRLKGETGVYEVKVKRKDGTELWVLISGAPFYNENEEVIGSIGVHYNITVRKNLEIELEKARKKAVKAQQAEKAFLANMSHEIRTPLNAIIGMSHLLQDTELDSTQKEYLDGLSSSAEILKSLISDILDISKIDAGSLETQLRPFDVKHLVNRLVRTIQVSNTNDLVTIKQNIDTNIQFNLVTDPQLLNQVLLNLLSNAQKFTEQGSITLLITLEYQNDKEARVLFSVEDTGIGIPENEIDSIFKEFKQANAFIRQKYGGTGLGLSISNELVKLLGGKLKVNSTVGKGSTFYFALDLKKSHETMSRSIEEPEEGILSKTLSTLVVEDNAMNLKYITSLLKKWRVDFDVCNNGLEAVNKTKHKVFDIIFMDLQMPIMDGFAATQEIRKANNLNRNSIIIALTASTFLSKKRLALKAGMTDFLSKPFTPNQLWGLITKYGSSQNTSTKPSAHTFKFDDRLDTKYLYEAYGDDLQYAQEMFETFLEIIDDEMILLKDSIDQGIIEKLKKALHRTKPTFSMVGLSELTQRIEQKEGDISSGIEVDWNKWYNQFSSLLESKKEILLTEVQRLKLTQSN